MPDPVLAFIEREIASPANRFGPEFLPEHLLLVEGFGLQLADRLGADRDVVRVAALLHDTAAIRDYGCVPVHADAGAALVEELCGPGGELASALNLTAARIAMVGRCCREHSSPKRSGETIPESVCVSNADGMAQIARPFYWFHYARTLKKQSYPDAVAWYRTVVEGAWNALIEDARAIVTREHETAMALVVPG